MQSSPVRVIAAFFGMATAALAQPSPSPLSPTNIFAPLSTPAQSVFDLSLFVLEVTGAIFVVVFSLLVYAVVKFRKKGSAQNERDEAEAETA